MKKLKLVVAALLLLTMVLALASCGMRSFEDFVDEEYVPLDTNPAYTTISEIGSLVDLEAMGGAGNLRLFRERDPSTGLTEYTVYDVVNDKAVWKKEETKSDTANSKRALELDVKLDMIQNAVYFTVTQTTTKESMDNGVVVKTDVTEEVYVYAYNGSSYAELAMTRDASQGVLIAQDLLYFDGKCYRANEDGSISYVFNYSTFAKFPSLSYSTPEYYVENQGSMWIVYDKLLNQVAAYEFPSFADVKYSTVIANNLFVQYYVAEDTYGDDYDIIENGNKKYSLCTVLIDLENGKEKEIQTDYVVQATMVASNTPTWQEIGFKNMQGDDVEIVNVCKIVDKRIDKASLAAQVALLDGNGKITVLKTPGEMPLSTVTFVATGLWRIDTVDGRGYFIDAEGEIKQEVTNATVDTSSYIIANGKLYDLNLQEVYDYEVDGLEYKFSTAKSVFFTNDDGELILYVNGQSFTFINKRAAEQGTREYSASNSSLQNGYFVIIDRSDVDNVKYEIYNIEGKLLKTVGSTASFSMSPVFKSEDGKACLVNIVTSDKTTFEVTSEYYVLK